MRQQLTSEFWNRQDQLIRSALVASLSSEVVPLVLSADTSFDVWTTLHNTYARPSRARLLGLKESLSQATKGTQSMSSYLQHIKQLVTTLNSAGATLTMDDITLHVIHGLSPEYRGICDSLRTRDSPITFDELHEKLCDYEAYLCRQSAASSMPITANFVAKSNSNNSNNSRNNKNNRQSTFQNQNVFGHRNNQAMNSRQSNKQSSRVICQYCDKPGHVVKQCQKLQAAFPWFAPSMESSVTSNSTGNSQPRANFVSSPTGSADWLVDSGASHHVTSDLQNLSLNTDYDGDDVMIGDGKSLSVTHSGSTTLNTFARPLHLSNVLCVPQIKKNLISVYQLCNQNNVSVKFSPSSFVVKDCRTGALLVAGEPRDGVYEWPIKSKSVSTPTSSHSAYSVHLSSVSTWHYRLGHPSSPILRQIFRYLDIPSKSIVSFYSDNGGEFIHLREFFTSNGISHFLTPPHTPEHNGTAERRHRHIVETGITLLHVSKLPLSFWSFAFQTAVYLINRMPTPLLHNESPHFRIFGSAPNYQKLRVFGCLCYPWLRPYSQNKLEPRSKPCVFVGYSNNQSAYKCFDPSTSKIFISRHVNFVEHEFPFSTLATTASRPTTETLSTWAPHFVVPIVSCSTKSAPLMVTHSVNRSSPCCLTSPSNDYSSNELMGISSGHGSSPSCINSSPMSVPPVVSTSAPATVQITSQWQTESSNAPSSSQSNITTSQIPQSKHVPPSHSMITRSKNNIHKPANKLCLSTQITNKSPLVHTSTSSHKPEPKNISQALKDLDWKSAMMEEYNALKQ
ncbi:hypothetical protein KY290_000337 [Solanum tuberosum]|uniref:Integrase catalytic domain-containing protein n=1 Tax=Solanum tuberosum TaxID=4113 RepID=A0ABQ7WJ16_SOLTU|nr:hypothetical protein KY290_000337 [Solanum tuberosum]